jgi:hypothetical protein
MPLESQGARRHKSGMLQAGRITAIRHFFRCEFSGESLGVSLIAPHFSIVLEKWLKPRNASRA